jgi:hypothetical protein
LKNFYSKDELNTLLSQKATIYHTHPELGSTLDDAVLNTVGKFASSSNGNVKTSMVGNQLKFNVSAFTSELDVNAINFITYSGNTVRASTVGSDLEILLNTQATASAADSLKIKAGLGSNELKIDAVGITAPAGFNIGVMSTNANDLLGFRNTPVTAGSNLIAVNGTSIDFAYDAEFAGNVDARSFDTISSRHLKNSIRDISFSALDFIRKVKIYKFNYLDESDDAEPRLGILAENEDSLISGEGHDSVDLSNLAGIVVRAIQELVQRDAVLQGAI